ncbi:MAG: molybdopterin-guanine dinucleotide biosynthesis protein B [Archaeoglobaceae archaeon]
MILSFVGKSGSGKTSLIERLVSQLQKLGYRVAVIKHAHKGFEIDVRGKDSYRIYEAGADVAVVHDGKIAIFRRGDLKLVVEMFKNYDLILTEGFSKEGFPKIALDDGEYENVIFRYRGNFETLLNFILELLEKKNVK